MPELTVAFDISSSLLKAIYTTDKFSHEMKLATLDVEVIEISRDWIKGYEQARTLNYRVEDEIYVEIGKSCYAVGRLAKERFKASDSLREVKYEKGVIRTLAVIGLMAMRAKLPSQFSLNLGVLLPYGEINDRETFRKKFEAALNGFKFRGKEYQVNLRHFSCLPEGAGVLLRGKTIDKKLDDCHLLILSIGYRNASYLLYQKGKIVDGGTTGLGFHSLLENLISMTSGLTSEEILPIVLKFKKFQLQNRSSHEFVKAELELLKKLVKRNENLGEGCRKLVKAIQVADEQYRQALCSWLETRQFPRVDEVIFTGGTAHYLHFELENWFKSEEKSWGDNIEKLVQTHLTNEEEYLERYQYRLTDNCGFFFFIKYDACRQLNP